MNKERSVLVLLPGGWKLDLFTTDLDSLGITVERWQSSDPAINADAPSIDIFVRPNLTVTTDAPATAPASTQPPKTPSFEGLLALLLEKMEDPEWRRDLEKDSPGDLAYLESLMSAIRGFFTEQGTTNEQDVLLAQAGFPRTAVTGCATARELRTKAVATTHSAIDDRINGIVCSHPGDTGLRIALEQLSRDIRRSLLAFVGCPDRG